MQGFLDRVVGFLQQPYRGEEMDALQWALFLLFVLAVLIGWAWAINKVQ